MTIRATARLHTLLIFAMLAVASFAAATSPVAAQSLLVADPGTNSVLRYDSTTGAFIDAFVPSGSGGLSVPLNLAFGPDGNLYVNSMGTNQVLRYNGSSGAFIDVFANDANHLQVPSALAFGPDGNLYVANYVSASVSRFNRTTGQFMNVFVASGSGGLASINFMYFRPDGYLYVSGVGVGGDGRIVRCNATTGQYVDTFVSGRSTALQDMVFGSDGSIYASFFHNNAGVEKYDGTTGAFLQTLIPGGTGGLNGAAGMLLTAGGTLYVASQRNASVLSYNESTGAFLGEFVTAGSGGLQSPNALVLTPNAVSNQPPTAVSGTNQTVRPGAPVYLNGSGSFDDNTATNLLSYAWTFVSTPPTSVATLVNANTIAPSFTPDVLGNYTVRLVVTDQGGLSSPPSDVLIGQNPSPTANAGLDQLVFVSQIVTLTGTANDAGGDALTYQWSFTAKPSGSAAQIYSSTQLTASFVPDLPGVYTVRLTPSDFLGAGSSDDAQILATTATGHAEVQIQSAAGVIGALPATAVTTGGNQNALIQFLSNASAALNIGDLTAARKQLQQAISRTDGCALRGAPDGNGSGRDWVSSCSAQSQIYPLLLDALNAILP